MWISHPFSLKALCLVGCFSFMGMSIHAERKHRASSTGEPSEHIVPDMLPKQSKKNVQTSVQMMQVSRGNSRVNTKFREGIDVSRYQGVIDWMRVGTEANVSFVYIKATEGSSLVDPTYAYNLANARQAGLSVGSYHFYRPKVSVDEQVDKFVADLQEFVERIAAYYGKKPLLYTYQNFYNRHLVGTFKGYHWVMAKYKDEEPMLTDNVDYMMWQYTQTGRLPGIRGNVDRIRLMGNHSLTILEM